MRREVVQTVHIVESLRICQRFAKFFHTAVDITHINVDFLDLLTVKSSSETEHAMRGRMLRPYIHYKVLGLENLHFLFLYSTVGCFHPHIGHVALTLILDADRIEFGIFIVILAQRISVPVDI